jgi:hypothetical protein
MKTAKRYLTVRRLLGGAGVAVLMVTGAAVVAPSTAFATGSSCYKGSCEVVVGSGLDVQTTDTYAQVAHCNQYLSTEQWDSKNYLGDYYIPAYYQSGCSMADMHLSWYYSVPSGENVYGQSYFSNAWQGIATVNIHS